MFQYHPERLACVMWFVRNAERGKKQFSPVWSIVVRAELFSAFLHLLPPPAGSFGSSAARSSTLILRSAIAPTAAPTVVAAMS